MTFGLICRKDIEVFVCINELLLLTHSQIVNGNLVETCGPYPRYYMSDTLLIY
ncbi:hypothetical protein QFZ87_002914 [Bacillus sp. SLBN-46]|nr:hypothetical protein [Bacillus sp. SLBN-46]